MVKFKVGDKLKASEYHKENWGLEWVTITSINYINKVYHWEAKEVYFGGVIHSGYFFDEAEPYISSDV